MIGICFVGIAGRNYIVGLFYVPFASNNIYEQQYQMNRFAVDYYKKPVAVNDLGYVSYKNDQYVLDLYGLASITALNYRKNNSGSQWMSELSAQNNVELAMIYDGWFNEIPGEWIKIGELQLGKGTYSVAQGDVSFYALNQKARPIIVENLRDFVKTLPSGVKFIFEPPGEE